LWDGSPRPTADRTGPTKEATSSSTASSSAGAELILLRRRKPDHWACLPSILAKAGVRARGGATGIGVCRRSNVVRRESEGSPPLEGHVWGQGADVEEVPHAAVLAPQGNHGVGLLGDGRFGPVGAQTRTGQIEQARIVQ